MSRLSDFGFPDIFRAINEDLMVPTVQRVAGTKTMRTDIRELDDRYEYSIELPGYQKGDIKLELEDGYMTVSATTSSEKTEKNKAGKIVHSERSYGSVRRTYFVGAEVTHEDIKAKFDSGELVVSIAKKEEPPKKEPTITIE